MRFLFSEKLVLLRRWRFMIVVVGLSFAAAPMWSLAQDAAEPNPQAAPEQPAEPAAAVPVQPEPVAQPLPKASSPQTPSVWDLTVQGGIFMIPIGLCSIVVVAFAIERYFGLRGKKIVPQKLLKAIQQLNSESTGIDPRQAYDVCQTHPSPLANVIRAAIMKVGRPHSELEKAVEDAVGREADEMAQNIRPINVCVSISPLLGLLGTVQGMILAFMVTSTTTATGAAKGQELAAGIYVALVTTFAGLCVAIPAILVANSLEGRIERLLRDMEDVFLEVLPEFERFEGKLRVTRRRDSSDKSGIMLKGSTVKPATTPAAPAPVPSKPAAPSKPAVPSKPAATVARPAPAADVGKATAANPKGLWGVMGARGETTKDE